MKSRIHESLNLKTKTMSKKLTLSLAIACLGLSTMVAQTQRTILYEEFTGENCPPCAATNPTVDADINPSFPNQILLIRFQGNIPSAPGAGSLYADDPTEVTTRQTYYNVPFAPYARFNGIVLPDASGGGNDGHAVFIDPSYYPNIINDSAIVNAPFGLTVNHVFNAAADSITITAVVTAAQAGTYTALKLQVCLMEAAIHFASPTGSNGEKDFHHIMRKMLPSVSGTTLTPTWTNTQTQTITLKAKVPTYIHDKSQIEIVAFVESDNTGATNRRVHNAAHSAPQAFTNDAGTTAIAMTPIQCATTINPIATITNTGSATMTSCTINYKVDAGTPASTSWSGSLASGATTTVSIPATVVTVGSHTLTVYTSAPNGVTDVNPNNDQTKSTFTIIGAPVNAPVAEPFTSTSFPPANWFVNDIDHDAITWTRLSATGSASGTGAARVYFYNSPQGNVDELFLPYNSFGASPAMTFYVAGSAYTAATPENDMLEFMISPDCGTTWSTLYSKSGTTLYTAPTTTASFAPANSSQWRMETVNVSSFANQSNLLMKFKGTSDYGNNVWVDDVNITGTAVGIQEQNKNVVFSSLYPNPATNSTTLLLNMSQEDQVKLSITNVMGETVLVDAKNVQIGDNNIALNTAAFASGVYSVVVTTSQGTVYHKLTVSK
jgi:hypothetical protein